MLSFLIAWGLLGWQDTPKFSARTNLVYLPTRVQDKKGETIYGLTAKDFVVEDNGARQTVTVEDDPETEGLSLVVLVQCSRSAPAEFAKIRGLGAMLDGIAGGGPHEVAILSYGEGPHPLSDFSSDPDAVTLGLARLKSCGEYGAATIDSVNHAVELLRNRKNRYRRAILLISEMRDHGSKAKLHEVAAQLGIADTVIYSVAFSPTKDEMLRELSGEKRKKGVVFRPPPGKATAGGPKDDPVIEHPPLFDWPAPFLLIVNALRANAASELAELSGGEYATFSNQKGFEGILQGISNRIHNYYLLSFEPPVSSAQLSVHTLRVTVANRPDAVIQTRKSYWSGL
jgi:VWFA-related protein